MRIGDNFLLAMAQEPSYTEQDHGLNCATWSNGQYINIFGVHGLQYFARHPDKDDNTHPHPPFGSSLRVSRILLNNAEASLMSIGWHNLTKGRISKEWSKLWSKAILLQLVKTCERAMIHALQYGTTLTDSGFFATMKIIKNDKRAVAEYK
jgi:hypothetical protein